jgi:hypothetical protein
VKQVDVDVTDVKHVPKKEILDLIIELEARCRRRQRHWILRGRLRYATRYGDWKGEWGRWGDN